MSELQVCSTSAHDSNNLLQPRIYNPSRARDNATTHRLTSLKYPIDLVRTNDKMTSTISSPRQMLYSHSDLLDTCPLSLLLQEAQIKDD